jgi:Thioredoxin
MIRELAIGSILLIAQAVPAFAEIVPLACTDDSDGTTHHIVFDTDARRQVAERFPHIEVHPDIWLKTRPLTSASTHLFVKAVQQWSSESRATGIQSAPSILDNVMWAFRCAFFRDCRDISRWDIQCEIAEALGVDIGAIEERIHSGIAFARLAADYQDADKMRIEGSPSFVLNEGRQKLYGNVGFHLMEANIQELIRAPRTGEASWC